METYRPPFTMTEEITNLVIEIAEKTGYIAAYNKSIKSPILRKTNKIRSIYSSLAIENNVLSIAQVTDLIDGKRVIGPAKDIQEAKNAKIAYDDLSKMDCNSMADFLKTHDILTNQLISSSGSFRNGEVGVYANDVMIHAGSPSHLVPHLMAQLFDWLKNSKAHPLIKSCVFHYEMVFIHPFADGNGRLSRFWHSLILTKWQGFFEWLPIESMIFQRQEGYYEAISHSNVKGDSTEFIEFMLHVINDALDELKEQEDSMDMSLHEKIMNAMKKKPTIIASELAALFGLSDRQVRRVIKELKDDGRIIREGSTKSGNWKVMSQEMS